VRRWGGGGGRGELPWVSVGAVGAVEDGGDEVSAVCVEAVAWKLRRRALRAEKGLCCSGGGELDGGDEDDEDDEDDEEEDWCASLLEPKLPILV
jgi:hypothetical protein